MKSKILYLFTRTPLHVGAGSSVGAIDQPIIRERHTGFPVIPGSSIKGVLVDANGESSSSHRDRSQEGRELFGSTKAEDNQAYSGSLSFGEGKMLLFSVRSAQGCFAWVTCPLVLARWSALTSSIPFTIEQLNSEDGLGDASTLGEKAVLEDTLVRLSKPVPAPLVEAIQSCIRNLAPCYADHVAKHLCIVSNDIFSHLVGTCCEIAQHVKIDDSTGTAAPGALFNQENMPAECLLYSPIKELRVGKLALLKVPELIQIGGDATTGLGFCDAKLLEA